MATSCRKLQPLVPDGWTVSPNGQTHCCPPLDGVTTLDVQLCSMVSSTTLWTACEHIEAVAKQLTRFLKKHHCGLWIVQLKLACFVTWPMLTLPRKTLLPGSRWRQLISHSGLIVEGHSLLCCVMVSDGSSVSTACGRQTTLISCTGSQRSGGRDLGWRLGPLVPGWR